MSLCQNIEKFYYNSFKLKEGILLGSRIMHLIIADQVSKKLSIENKQTFLIGGIAPDAALTRESKTESHFLEGSLEAGTRRVNYNRFVEKYRSVIQSDYTLGYLTHLIADDVWMKEVYFKNDFKNRVDADPGLLKRWHNDFRKLNGQLIEWFGCENLENELKNVPIPKNRIIEIGSENLQNFKEEAIKDFAYTEDDLKEELEVYTLKQILDYIDAAVKETIDIYISTKGKLDGSK